MARASGSSQSAGSAARSVAQCMSLTRRGMNPADMVMVGSDAPANARRILTHHSCHFWGNRALRCPRTLRYAATHASEAATLLHMQGANLTHVRLLRTRTSRNEQQTLVHTGLALCSTISICYVLRYYVNTISPHSCYIASKHLEVIVRALC